MYSGNSMSVLYLEIIIITIEYNYMYDMYMKFNTVNSKIIASVLFS